MLQFFSASNGFVNSRTAMSEALNIALDGEGGTNCDLIVFHSTMGHNFKDLLDEARKLAPKAQVVGCTCAGVIGKEGANETMKGLAIMAIKGNSNEFTVASNENITGANSYAVAEKLAKEIKEKNPKVNMVMILASGIDIAADRAIEGIEAVFGKDIPIFGGTSADNMRAISSFQFVNDKVLERGIAIVGFSDPTLEIHMRAHHGSVPIGMPFTVTRSEANRVHEIEGQPAWPYLMGQLGLPATTHPGQTIPIAGLGEELPVELHDENDNRHILRVIVKKDENNSSFYMPVDCPVGTKLWLTRRDENLIFNGLDKMMNRMVKETGGRKPVAVFHTDCGARGKEMFNQILKEEIVNRMQFPICKGEKIPWLGMYGFGEFTKLGGHNKFHNYTTSIYAIIRKGT